MTQSEPNIFSRCCHPKSLPPPSPRPPLQHAHEAAELIRLETAPAGTNCLCIGMTHKLPRVDAIWDTHYTAMASGDIVVQARFKPGRNDLLKLPRLGTQMELPAGF